MIIGDYYKMIRRLTSGGFGQIILGMNVLSQENVAIKLESLDQDTLTYEAKVLQKLSNIKGIPSLRYFGIKESRRFLVMDLLDKTLQSVAKQWHANAANTANAAFPLDNYMRQLFTLLQKVHDRGYLHRDIKPENIMVMESTSTIYLIDFGMSRCYYVDDARTHRPNSQRTSIVGTSRYVSANVHNGNEPSRRDDLISIIYVAVYCAKCTLPWSHTNSLKQISDIKNAITPQHLCVEMPAHYALILEYLINLSYDDAPNYEFILSHFK